VLHLRTEPLRRLNAIDPLEVFTLFHGQAVALGQVVCSVKVAPHLLPGAKLLEGLRIAKAEGPIVEVRPYRPMDVGAIAVQAITADALARFEAGARAKVAALGGTFEGAIVRAEPEPATTRVKPSREPHAGGGGGKSPRERLETQVCGRRHARPDSDHSRRCHYRRRFGNR